ncbi:N,N-dimethylformamidase beta subunit family domain-containing protein [Plastoroseomonas hellenica]|uniref:N,N-dimethylformamidase beta subunit family domain-containing protein n=1 Tax=Plastoroseomonas hellenica TaxID=2687306 RepID=UPI001BADEF84|nr:N,N-dimethylformamidase beta subunit family domain-containing protein [Plastoroseomonas hellenica]MBR0644314.1 N,N-dimethylformamidase [Plastoroseomonas hellenica]
MLPVTGYADRWSVRQGETIRFMISVAGGGAYRARVARILCGDPNPAGPGYREVPVLSAAEGEHAGVEQPIRLGSCVDVPALDLGASAAPVALLATIWPTRPDAGEQAVLSWSGGGVTLTLGFGPEGATCHLETGGRALSLTAETPLTERCWHDIACRIDPVRGMLELAQAPRRTRLDREERAERAVAIPADSMPTGLGAATIAARRHGGQVDRHFDGKIARPRILRSQAGLLALLHLQASGAAPVPAETVADWDFSLGIPTDTVADTGPGRWHGRCVNLPMRAMTGPGWSGAVHRWTESPREYDAIHFHADDIGDAGWAPSLTLAVPEDWPSGVYALHLETEAGRDNIVFYVRARVPGRQARVAFLAPTFSYTIYGQFVRPGRQREIAARAAAWGSLPQAPDGHPEYGLSTYNFHADGSGVAMASMRRPMIDKRVGQFHLMDPDPAGSGTYWIAADSYITDLLDRRGIGFEVITDHDVHAEGAALLSRYDVVLTGQHPEYHSVETLDAIATYLETGGRFVYLGGNGFYWRVAPHPDGPWALEVRRAEGGIRLWEALPGEGYHAFDGSYGGLWRRLGRPPQALVGVGFSSQGVYKGFPYTFADAVLDPRVAFLREGLEGVAVPGGVFGERGLMGGGAAGHELDRADVTLGTPRHALVIASAVVEDPSYQPVNEERRDHTWPGPREEIIRSDLTFFETPNGGAVFSVGSMNFIGALPVDGYANPVARLVENLVRRFADPTPFPPPGRG